MLLVILARGIDTATTTGSVVATHCPNEKVHAVCFDSNAVCRRAAPQDLHESITLIDVPIIIMESTYGVRSNANLEASGFELCKSDLYAQLHKLGHRLDSETCIE